MRLSDFIDKNHERIIENWVAFAETLLPWAKDMDEEGLRDHAEDILTAVVADMRSPQSKFQQSEKSKGNAEEGDLAEIGQKHASDRLETGLNLNQLLSEYRALRASVLKLWEEERGDEQGEITRFNEAIDETLAMSTAQYSETVDNTREQFLGMLSHDLRNPIGSIIMGATLLKEADRNDIEGNKDIASRILNSGERINRMVNELLDFTRTRLGSGIPVTSKPMEFSSVCKQVISELQALHPNSKINFESHGDLVGEWDSDRLAQVVSNLVSNALQYGSSQSPIHIVAQGGDQEIKLLVHNEGSPIPKKALKTIFSPMTRHSPESQNGDKNPTGLGLGLFIASEVVAAHSGTISVTSTKETGTTFTVMLPRSLARKHPYRDRSVNSSAEQTQSI